MKNQFEQSQTERSEKCFDQHYENLTPEQICVTYSLRQVGWFLNFVRINEDKEHIAFFINDGKHATVNGLGEIDYKPELPIRS
jgi:hypothetical protein